MANSSATKRVASLKAKSLGFFFILPALFTVGVLRFLDGDKFTQMVFSLNAMNPWFVDRSKKAS
jgi:hypothetical protein